MLLGQGFSHKKASTLAEELPWPTSGLESLAWTFKYVSPLSFKELKLAVESLLSVKENKLLSTKDHW